MINTILSEIRYLSTPSHEIIDMLCAKSEFDDLVFLKCCSNKMASGSDFREAWSESFGFPQSKRYLSKSDITVIKQFGNRFGTTDIDGQVSGGSMYLESIKTNLSESRKKKEQYSNMIYGLSVLCGVGIMIVFI